MFPVTFHLFGHDVSAHAVFEGLAYIVGFQTYLWIKRRRPSTNAETILWMIAGAIVGALVGSKLLAWVESWPEYWARRNDPAAWLGGKTIVGGLLGGWVGVEIVKKIHGISTRTGDAYVVPLCIAIAIGRVGCFLTGLPDHTYGVATSLPWGVDFGDGIARHPTQLYESLFTVALAIGFFVTGTGWKRDTNGRAFRLVFLAYLTFRLLVEFIKPSWKPLGVSAIQTACLIGAAVCVWQLVSRQPPGTRTLKQT